MKSAWLVVLALLVWAPTALAAPARTSVVGGAEASIASHPWQVALLERGASSDPWVGQYCGGTVRDATHVITAAHCVFAPGPLGSELDPDDIEVLVGATNLVNPLEPGAQRLDVEDIAFDPRYDDVTFAYDAAVLTLESPGITTASASFAGLGDPGRGEFWDGLGGDAGSISGWGFTTCTSGSSCSNRPRRLQAATVPIVDNATCASLYGTFNGTAMLCAGNVAQGGVDTCHGDSGGPLTVQDPGFTRRRLVGITSSGSGCAQPGAPGVYTRVAEASMLSFLRANGLAAPTPAGLPAIAGTPAIGQTLQCLSPAWQFNPGQDPSLDYGFERVVGASAFTVGTAAGGSSYVVQPADAGGQLRCVVRGENAGGWAEVRSAVTAAVPGQPRNGIAGRDIAAPRARIARASCNRLRCRLTVTVSDRAPSSGVKGITARVKRTVTRSCIRRGRRTRCASTFVRTLVPRRLSSKLYVVTLARPVRGVRYTFTITAVDKANNRQARPLTRILRLR